MALNPRTSPDDIAARAGGLLMRLGLAVLMVVLPLAAIYSRRLVFTLMPIAAGLIFLGATLIPGNTILADVRRGLLSSAGLAALALGIWVAASAIWSPFRRYGLEQLAKVLGTVLLAFVVVAALPSRSRLSNLNLMPIGAGLAAVAAAVLVLVAPATVPNMPDLELSTLERAAVGLVLAVWPALTALGVRERWSSGGALAVAVTVAAVAVWTPGALAGMAAGALVFSLSMSNPRRMAKVLAYVFAFLILATPLLVPAAEKIAQIVPGIPLGVGKGLAGWMELYRSAPEKLITGFGFNTLPAAYTYGLLPSQAPFNLLFEIWFELGILGAILSAALVFISFRAAGRIERHGAPFLLAALTCVLVIALWGLATFHLWWITLLGAMAISFGCVLKGLVRDDRPAAGKIRSGLQPA
jgi:hypothetical protein